MTAKPKNALKLMSMENSDKIIEQLGIFYLGKEVNPKTQELTDELVLYKNKNLTTHAALIGMTGSGKTGLGIDIIEEAILDNIPVIIIDPKGDMGNLLLTFPSLKPEEFEPWVDPVSAETKGLSVKDFAKKTASLWENGIGQWHQDKSRIKKLKENAEFVIYTPGSSAGVQLSVLASFDAPSPDVIDDPDTFMSVINAGVSSLLALIKLKGDILQSKEYLLLSNIFAHVWRKGLGISLEQLIGYVTNPPFDKIGVLPLKSFYPQTQRLDLAMKLNTVLASPGFAAWTQGEALNINRLMYNESGKAKVSILNIAHLDEGQRMFFVTLFLNRYISWMRMQKGTSALRNLLYMDEIFGFFPAVGNPPSKQPMLLLLKQARAFGTGIILATQNPIDLDYKGLSNIGTWFIGRLQTKQDKERVMDGLIQSSEGALSKKEVGELLSNIQSRVFLLKSAHEDNLRLMQTRWVLSYLRGPLSKQEIRQLMKPYKEKHQADVQEKEDVKLETTSNNISSPGATSVVMPMLPQDAVQYFAQPVNGQNFVYQPYLLAEGKVRFVNATRGIDLEKKVSMRFVLNKDMQEINYPAGEKFEFNPADYGKKPFEQVQFAGLPGFIENLKSFKSLKKEFSDYLYRNNKLELYKCTSLKAESKPCESLDDFKMRLMNIVRDRKEDAIEKLRSKYSKKAERLQVKYDKLMIKLDKEKADVTSRTADSAMSFGMAVLGAFLGGGTRSKTRRGISSASKIAKEKVDVRRVEKEINQVRQDMSELKNALQSEAKIISEKFKPEKFPVTSFFIKPRRSDVYDVETAVLWEAN
jgi:hypothetical protein